MNKNRIRLGNVYSDISTETAVQKKMREDFLIFIRNHDHSIWQVSSVKMMQKGFRFILTYQFKEDLSVMELSKSVIAKKWTKAEIDGPTGDKLTVFIPYMIAPIRKTWIYSELAIFILMLITCVYMLTVIKPDRYGRFI